MIHTSYFSFVKNISPQLLVAISGGVPDGFLGSRYPSLAPKYNWWKQWRDNKLSNEWYADKYYETVLDKLDPVMVAQELDGKILLCWESPDKFCHRQLVADWLRPFTEIKELSTADIQKNILR